MKPGEIWKGVTVHDLVDAQPAIDYIRDLHSRGMLVKDMSEQSGLNDRTIWGYLKGFVSKGKGPRPIDKCVPETLRRILAIQFVEGWTNEGFRPDLFRGLRESRGLPRHALAKASGICAETIQYWETGRNKPKDKRKVDAVLSALGASWGDVSTPPAEEVMSDDSFEMVLFDGFLDPEVDYIPDYPCLVCGGTFRSRVTLARHPHPKKVKVSA